MNPTDEDGRGGVDGTARVRVIERGSLTYGALVILIDHGPLSAAAFGVRFSNGKKQSNYGAQMFLGRLRRAGYARTTGESGSPQWEATEAGLSALRSAVVPRVRVPRKTTHRRALGPNETLVGERFGFLTVLSESSEKKRWNRCWLCRCDCGTEIVRTTTILRAGGVRSCGCGLQQLGRITHGHAIKRKTTPTWRSWHAMRTRCFTKGHPSNQQYGARGITVCERWRDSFENFLADMGERPAGKTLDRINNDGNYEPGNCRWATAAQQNQNSRNAKLSHEKAEQMRELSRAGVSYSEIGRRFGVSVPVARAAVLGIGWSKESA